MTSVTFVAGGILFEWDAVKAATNLEKHGIAFVDAAQAIAADTKRVDFRVAYASEPRRIRLVDVQGRMFAVVYVSRGSAVRVISVRRARKAERAQYDSV